MSDSSKRAGGFSREKSELFELLLKKKHIDLPQSQTIPRRTGADPCQLSFAQQRLWFLDQLESDSPLYNMPAAVRLTGHLKMAALEQSFNEIVRRHEALRTRFAIVDGNPVQVIAPTLSVPLPLIDLSGLPEAERAAEAQRLTSAEARRSFDLARGPVFRASLLRLNDEEHVLLITMHHIISDGWSLGVFMRELTALYEAFSQGQPSPFAELPIQYADYAVWQRAWLTGEQLERQLSYWRKQLGSSLTELGLPTDHPRPAVQSYRGATQRATLSKELTEQLRALSQREGVTLFMTLLAAFQTLLMRYSGQEDIVIGSPIANRNRIETEGLIGFFVNTLVLRTELSGNPTFRELVGRVKEVTLGAYAHQDLPFEKVVEELHPERTLSQNPLFQVVFQLMNAPRSSLKLSGLTLGSQGGTESGTAKFDLSLFVYERAEGEGLPCLLEYSTDLFNASTIERMLGHFQVLLEGIVANPNQRLCELPLLSEAERHQLLVEWNDTETKYGRDQTVAELFEAQVKRTPDAIAVVYEGEQLTYGELNRRANQVAHYLRGRGVRPEVLVAIMMERSLEMVIGLLGILKAGGAYVPLDAAYPQERLAFMLADAAVAMLVTEAKLVERVPKSSEAERICLDTEWKVIGQESTENLESEAAAENLAYVIYTSGSTGQPKGVAVQHRSIVRLVKETNYVGLTSDQVFLQFAPVSFDASTFELWGCLLNGARLVVFPAGTPSLKELGEVLRRSQVTTLWLTAGLFHQMVDDHLEDLRGVRQLLTGGDVLSVPHVEKALRELRDCRLINGYGPTENTTFTCCHPMAAGVQLNGSVPIGRPIANTQVYVLDQYMEPVPVGVAGELYIGGDGLARGYLNRAELTQERFIGNPFSAEAGARLYKTGDRVRYLADGTLEFLGRFDHQVKVRGYRIELEEIEAVLSQHRAVEQAVVLAREDVVGDKRLVAYIVQDSQYESADEQSSASELQAEQVMHWQTLYEDLYSQQGAAQEDPTFNITGWNSSYTGEAIPAAEMREWLEHTVERIVRQQPQRVLEIGCGTGLLLFQVVPHCQTYVGTDFSQAVLDRLQPQVAAAGFEHVTLWQREAIDFEGIAPASFDTVIINSVVQYFPSVDYLVRVLARAVRVVRPGGTVFIGDVRNFELLEAFHASVELHRASPTSSVEQLRQRVQEQITEENELVVAPSFFTVLKEQVPEVCYVEVMPKRGYAENELTRFRYDVIMHIGEEPVEKEAEVSWLDWQKQRLSLETVRRMLEETQPEVMGLRRVPNGRVLAAAQIMEVVSNRESLPTVGELRQALPQMTGEGVNPEELWELGQEAAYAVEVSWAGSGRDGRFDAVLRRCRKEEAEVQGQCGAIRWPGEDKAAVRAWSYYANAPLARRMFRTVVPQLREYLQGKLPEYMVPQAFVLLGEMPLTPNGKVDRRALPAPDRTRPELEAEYVAPRSAVEEVVAGIWSEVLDVEQVGVYDNFFELGGHSLKATQVVSRLREALQVELPLRSLFEVPTVATLSTAIEAARQASGPLQAPPILPVSRDGNLPLSFAQQRLWFLDQLEPNSSFYNMPQAIRMSGPLDTQALRETFTEIAARHESLRTSFTMTDGDPVQVIAPAMSVELPMVDLSELPEGEREEEARRLAKEEAQRPFDLEHGPLLRATLLRLNDEEHVLLLNMHHIVSDGWSLGVLFRELGPLYKAFSTGKPSPLPKLPIQYADYAVWQREWLAGERLEQQLSYWKEQLSGAPPILSLPADHPRPAAQSYRGARQALRMSKEVTERLKALTQEEGATLFTTMLAAFQTLLMRYTGQEDIVVGSVIAGRVRAEVEGLIGFFVNTLVLRTDLSGDPSFRELLGRVREVTLGAYEHQDVPFEKLVEELQPERSLSHTPLFQVMLTLQNAPKTSLEFSGLTLGGMSFDSQMPVRSDIDVFLSEASGEMVGYFAYNTDLFDASTVARMLCHFHVLLEGIIADPDRRLSELPLLTEAERQLLLVEWNETTTQYPRDNTVHQLFEAQVERTPDAVAVVCEDQRLTYRELNGRANQVAHYLRRKGVAPEVLVGIMMERSPEMVVGLLGILKAGGAYVPLDPAYPQERLAFMLEDTQSPVLLTQSKLVESVPQSEVEVVCIDREWIEIAEEGRENPSSEGTAENVAYVIYTSGSTGKPKGAMILHRGVVNYLSWCIKWYAVADGGGAPVHSPLGFDLTVTSLFSPLLVGQRVVLVREETGVEAVEALGAALRHEGPFSLVKLTPSHLELLSQSLPTAEDAGRTRALIIGGEALTGESLVFWQEHAPETRLINEYGPTETVVGCCVYELAGGQRLAGAVPIGRPIANTHLYVLDAYLNPVPVGVTGELFVGGDGLARGYLNRPELTAERFIADPFATGPGARLYRTGDLARYLPDGNLEFLGRLDNQVKVRGYRIELGEIEAVMNQHPTVRETVVVVRGEGGGDKRLVAYLVACEGSAALNTSELRSYLRGRLPEYMVPQSFVLLNEMPLTSNGKVDRRALPEHDGGRPAMDGEYVGPRTGVEEEMARIWVEVLGIKQVGVYDNFFELGGHSLLATRVVSRVRKNMEVELPLRAIFEEPTVAGLAVAVTERRGGRQDSPIVKMERANRGNAGQLLEMLDQLSDEEVNSLLGDVLAGKEIRG